jgi:cob(I)alamin adenosyltransferase
MSIATRRGDQGETDLLFGHRISKKHPRIHVLGDVDELNAALGLLRVHARTAESPEVTAQVQRWLIDLMGEVATPPGLEQRYAETHPHRIGEPEVVWLDEWVDRLEKGGAMEFKGWALPGAGGSVAGAQADFARTVCRRAERVIVELADTAYSIPNPQLPRFLNRLSDVLWLLARWEEKAVPDIPSDA